MHYYYYIRQEEEEEEEEEEEVKPWSQGWLIAAGAYPGFCSMKLLEVFQSTSPGRDASPSQVTPPAILLGFPSNSQVPIYTPRWREAL